MNPYIKREYLRLRALGWQAQSAIRAARAEARWREYEDRGLVRLEVLPEYESPAYIAPEFTDKRDEKEYYARAEREGMWYIVTQYRTSEDDDWSDADNCGGFIGDDWRDSGYDVDLKLGALEALDDAFSREAETYAERATYASAAP